MELSLIFVASASVFILMSLGWLYQNLRSDAGIVDVLWTAAVGLLGVFYAWFGDTSVERRVVLMSIVSFWALRLGVYILFDRVIGKKEDGRYQNLRKHWGSHAPFKFFWFFQAQGLAALFFSVPFYFISQNKSTEFSVTEAIGLFVWLVAFSGEWISDRQLQLFKSDEKNRGKTCRDGLWRYSRHPNYFFEWLHWCSYPLMLFGQHGFYPSLLCPLVMLFTLFKLTGIPHTEAQAIRSRGDDYRRYQEETSMFIPWFPRQKRC